jgi:hypothetical protein
VSLVAARPARSVCLARPMATSCRSLTSEYIAGTTSSVRIVLLTIPPIIGAAMRFITLAPVPVPHRMGSNPIIVDATVMIFGHRCNRGRQENAPRRERTGRQWNRYHVVPGCPPEILHHLGLARARQGDDPQNLARVTAHEDQRGASPSGAWRPHGDSFGDKTSPKTSNTR